MATLTTEQRDDLSALVQQRLSATFDEMPATSDVITTTIGHFDDAMEAAEQDIINNRVSSGVATWLMDNQTIARRILEEVARVRRENL